MEQLNQTLFLWINAAPDASHFSIVFAILCGKVLIWALPLMLVIGGLFGSVMTRRTMWEVLLAAVLSLAVNQFIGMLWPHPRPFVLGLGRQLIAHVADPSFPSNHMVLMSVTAVSLWLQGWRRAGVVWSLMALLTAWARIYLGVHFPFDMLGAIVVACLIAVLCRRYAGRPLDVVDRLWQRAFRG